MKNNKLGIYIHVPFCAHKCGYCDFYSCAGCSEAEMDAYAAHLCGILPHAAAEINDGIDTVDTIYFGGGTPSLLGGARLARVLDTVTSVFPVEADAEITAEANPDSMTEEFLHTAYAAGVNRLSMGIQSADDAELKRLGRIHTFAQACNAYARARQAGFANISVDLMYALPEQTLPQLLHSINALLALEPEHLSCYGLTLEPHTPLGRQQPILPDEDAQADMYLALCDRMKQAGFLHYEISNFAKPNYHSRHNSRYWQQRPYLGLGPGAHGDLFGMRYEIPSDLHAWLSGQAKPTAEDTDIDRAAEYIMLSLRTAQGWDSAVYQQQFQEDPAAVEKVLSSLPIQYISHTQSRWHLTDEGFLLSNAIIGMALDAR